MYHVVRDSCERCKALADPATNGGREYDYPVSEFNRHRHEMTAGTERGQRPFSVRVNSRMSHAGRTRNPVLATH